MMRPASALDRRVKRALDLHDVVLIEPVDLDDGPWRIRTRPPELLLHLVDDRPEAIHIGHVNDQTHGISQRRALGFRDQLHVQERLERAGFVAWHEGVSLRIDPAHAGDEYEVASARAKVPRTGRLDRSC